jgi:hypothetical protein
MISEEEYDNYYVFLKNQNLNFFLVFSEQVIFVRDAIGHYVVCFDPLDGSSNIDVNVRCFKMHIFRFHKLCVVGRFRSEQSTRFIDSINRQPIWLKPIY